MDWVPQVLCGWPKFSEPGGVEYPIRPRPRDMFRNDQQMCRLLTAFIPLAALLTGCGIESFLNQTASFGPNGSTAAAGAPIGSGLRGTIQVVIENNTPFRAVFTYGVFDNTDERSTPAFLQFSPESNIIAANSSATLEGNTNSGVVVLPCARVFSVGSRSLINLIDLNPGDQSDRIDADALIDGVGFTDADLTSDAAATPNQGFARGFEARLGVDFNCDSLLLVSLEFNDVGADAFRVRMKVIPSRNDN